MKRVLLTLTLVLFITPIVKAQDLPSYIPTDGLVAYYPFNGNANDESGNDHHGVVNEATLSDGLRGENTAYNFGSDSAYISVPSSSQLSLSNVDFTICALVKLDSYPLSQSDEDFNQYFTILGKRQYARTTRNYSIGISTPNSNIGGLKFTFAQGPRGVGSFVYSDLPVDTTGDWNNLVVVYTQNNSTIKFFVNSELVYQQDGIIIDGENDADLWFGKDVSGYANDFPGKIDDIGIWNRALTEQVIQNLYTSSSGDIILNGVVSAENHQIKNVADPTDAQDAVTKSYFESNRLLVPNKNIEQILSVGNDANGKQLKGLADPTDAQDAVTKNYLVASQSNTYSQQQVDQIISNLQEQINTLKAQSVNYGSNTFSSVIEVQNSLKPEEQIFTISDNTVSNTIQGTNGTVIYINPNAITLNGSPYTGVVKATLDEYLTPNSMILSGIQTTSNGELLVTGGSFELDLEGEFGEDLDLANWSTSASMPLAVNLSNDFKSAMRFYVGERLQIDGREQVNWELNDFEEFRPPWQGFSEFYGINLGLSNCDVLYSSVIQGLGTQFSVLLEGVSDYNNAIVWMFINDFPSVVQITSLIENEQGFKTYADSIPVGLNATLLAIYVDEDDYLKFGTLEINVQGDEVFTIPMSFGTKDSLKALIENF